jgi:hypothetical protein
VTDYEVLRLALSAAFLVLALWRVTHWYRRR